MTYGMGIETTGPGSCSFCKIRVNRIDTGAVREKVMVDLQL